MKDNRQMVVYSAINNINKMRYVGQTVGLLDVRIRGHLNHSRKETKYKSYFQQALLEYGEKSFSWEVLCECKTINELNQKENKFIKKFNTLWPNGYNARNGGGNSMLSKEIKKGVHTAFRLSQEDFDTLQKHAEKEEHSVSSLVRKFVKEGLRRMKEDGRF